MPGIYYGPYGTQFDDHAEPSGGNAGRFPLGHVLVLPDGRTYRYSEAGGTAPVAGSLYQSVAPVANHTDVAVLSTTSADIPAVGDTSIAATLGATSAAQDIYSEGIVHFNDDTGEAYAHRIKRAVASGDAHAAAEGSATLTVNLAAGDTVQLAATSDTTVSFTRNRFHSVIIHPSPPTAMLAGVAPLAGTASQYFYTQVAGEAAVLTDGTLLVGNMVQASISTNGAVEGQKVRITAGSTAGADTNSGALLEDQDGAETLARMMGMTSDSTVDITGPIAQRAPLVGICVKVNATTEHSLIDLLYLGGAAGVS